MALPKGTGGPSSPSFVESMGISIPELGTSGLEKIAPSDELEFSPRSN